MVFGGIAGVVSIEQGEAGDHGQIPTINTKSNEVSDMQDIYRRTLAASWSSRVGDTPADKLIEGLFSGGSPSPSGTQGGRAGRLVEDNHDVSSNDTDSRRTVSGGRLSPSFEKQPRTSPSSSLFPSEDRGPEFTSDIGQTKKRGSIEQQLYNGAKGKSWKSRSPSNELSEFDVREDLRSWEVSAME